MILTLSATRTLSTVAAFSLVAACSGGGSSPTVTATPTPTPTAVPTTATGSSTSTAYTCPTSNTVTSAARGSQGELGSRRGGVLARTTAGAAPTGLIAVSYAGTSLSTNAKSLAVSRETSAGARLVRELSFAHIDRYQRILSVTPGSEASAIAKLRVQTGVLDATMTGLPRRATTVAAKYYSNDPYYNGFTAAQLTASSDAATPTYHVDPYEESASVPGQWGNHAVRLDYAQAYSQSGNGSGVTNAGALGSATVKIAVIDTGVDSAQPEIASKIVSHKCFLTDTSGNQSTSSFAVDQDGHGTDVAGIAADVTNNSLGFVGTGGAATVMAYQVFPRPDDTCIVGDDNPDAQCDASSTDIASAIDDAVSNGASVINLSLGGGTCTNGQDSDTTEGAAVAEAIAANVIVVAAAGNAGSEGVSAPGCDQGVIAVGASALSDGVVNGSSTSPAGTAAAPVEYVASYSQYGAPAAAIDNANAWGIVAPGGDPSDADVNSGSTDDLHWIENIWTSTPYDSNFAGSCTGDLGSPSGTTDCRTLIAGTSQATPIVSGAVALLIAANATYKTPAKMKQLLCSTAHEIGDAHEGCGRLDLYRAMATVVGDENLPASK